MILCLSKFVQSEVCHSVQTNECVTLPFFAAPTLTAEGVGKTETERELKRGPIYLYIYYCYISLEQSLLSFNFLTFQLTFNQPLRSEIRQLRYKSGRLVATSGLVSRAETMGSF